MNRLWLSLVAFALTFVTVSPALAEPIPWTMDVTATGGGESEHGGISFPQASFHHEGTDSRGFPGFWGADNLFEFDVGPNPDNLGPILPEQSAFTLHVHLVDLNSGEGGDLTFTTSLSGDFTPTGGLFFASPSFQPQSLVLGGNRYTISISSELDVTPEGSPPEGIALQHGSVGADLTVEPAGPNEAPEPATLALAGLGLVGLGAAWRCRRPAPAARNRPPGVGCSYGRRGLAFTPAPAALYIWRPPDRATVRP